MKSGEYERAYSEARAVLYRRGKRLEKPSLGPDGIRYCSVDGTPLTDRELLQEAWGESLAAEILYERATQRMLGRAG
jgi:hypothetical protein